MHAVYTKVTVQTVKIKTQSANVVCPFLQPLIKLGCELCKLMLINIAWVTPANYRAKMTTIAAPAYRLK